MENPGWAAAVLGIVGFCLPALSNSSTSIDTCEPPGAESHLSIGFFRSDTTSLENGLGTTDREDYSSDLLVELNENWMLGGGHRSAVLNVEQIELQTNGYLHSFYFPMHWRSQRGQEGFRLSLAPVLSASSNVTSDLDEYTTDALQLLFGVLWYRELSSQTQVRYGLCGDHRFGEYRVYPLISVDWQLNADWLLELGFPTSRISFQLTDGITSAIRITPNGNEWYVKDDSLEKNSQVVYEAYLLEWALGWQALETLTFTASVAREFDSQYAFTLADDRRVQYSADPATRIGVELTWTF